ncbi:MAG: fatty acid desaturase [Alphaproteobacteria bacterium]|nr:fatty acid desaturase [Alphaproteobacteria bacterium]
MLAFDTKSKNLADFPRDYSLTGPLNRQAVERGLANAEWYRTDIPRARMKELMQRSDGPATRDTAIWLGSMIIFAALGIYLWPSFWSIPFFLSYGVLYGSASDSRWHECGHGTAFRTAWKNEAVYQIASFMIMRNPVIWKWSHSRHHTDTIIVGRDPEIVAMRPPDLFRLALNFFGLIDAPMALLQTLRQAFGVLSADEKDYVPESEWPKVYHVARIWVLIYVATLALCFAAHSILPLMVIGLPRLYGTWHALLCGLTQHIGLAEDVLDHRQNCRTVYMNPVSRFIYWNMNYHVEHHMFPMVPYHRLPELHAEMLSDTPAPYNGFLEAYREILPTIIRQLKDPDYFVRRVLPTTAKPFKSLPKEAV